MNYLITGASGFIGSYFVRQILFDPANSVTVITRDSACLKRLDDVRNGIQVVEWNWDCSDDLLKKLCHQKFNVCAHFAWSGVTGENRNTAEQICTNLHMMTSLLNAAGELGVQTFLGLGSQAEYGRVEGVVSEQTPEKPVTQYGKAKQQVRLFAEHFCKEAQIRFLWCRLFSLYGPDEDLPWLIPSIVHQLFENRDVLLTSCEQVRDYLHVDDAACALSAAIAQAQVHGIYNIASGYGIVLRRLVEMVASHVQGSGNLKFGALPQREDQTKELIADIAKFCCVCDWEQKVDLATGIAETVHSLITKCERHGKLPKRNN